MATRNSKHSAARLSTYLSVHETVLHQFISDGFIGRESLTIEPSAGRLRIRGEVGCSGRILVYVDKILEIVDDATDPLVQTINYTYNVSLQGGGNLFRYDSPHEDHNQDHHKHVFDRETFEEIAESPLLHGLDGWPTLGEVVQEAARFYWENFQALSSEYPVLGRRR